MYLYRRTECMIQTYIYSPLLSLAHIVQHMYMIMNHHDRIYSIGCHGYLCREGRLPATILRQSLCVG